MNRSIKKFEYRPSQHVLQIIRERGRREQQVIDSMRPLDPHSRANQKWALKQVMLFTAGEDVAVSFVTTHGTTNVTMSPEMISKLGRRMLKVAKLDFSRTTLQCE